MLRPPNERPPYEMAMKEHAWLLRAEGLSLRAIAGRCGGSETAAMNRIRTFGRRVRIAMIYIKRGKYAQP